jgi:hypothetical protein
MKPLPISRQEAFKNGVMAALEICAHNRAVESGFNTADLDRGELRYMVERAAAIIDAAAARLKVKDHSALESVCASQVLSLDVIFDQYAREASKYESMLTKSMTMALKAQSQCRSTLKTYIQLTKGDRASKQPAVSAPAADGPQKNFANFAEQTNGTANPPT